MGLFKFSAPPELSVSPAKAAPEPAFLRRGNARDKGVAGRAAEKSLAKRVGGSMTPGSGALDGAKGDVKVGDFLMENKTSTNDSFSIKKDHLFKIYQEGLEIGKHPALSFQFVNSHGDSDKRERWVCIPESVFKELIP